MEHYNKLEEEEEEEQEEEQEEQQQEEEEIVARMLNQAFINHLQTSALQVGKYQVLEQALEIQV